MSGSTPTGIMPTGSTALLDQVRRVEVFRQEAGRFGLALAQRRAQFDADNAGLLNAVGAIKEKLAEEELRLRDMAVAEFKATGEKKPAPGVTVSQKVDLVYSEGDAFAWAKQKNMALALDCKAFEAIAKATDLDFVTKVDTAAASLSKNLGAALKAAQDAAEIEAATIDAAAPAEEGAAF